jgi:hypothetical protein
MLLTTGFLVIALNKRFWLSRTAKRTMANDSAWAEALL